MTISKSTLSAVLDQALDDFFQNEVASILDGVSERNNCQRLSIYLEQRASEAGIKGYYADTEYNRKQGGRVKTILDADMEVVVIQSDLILHSRGASVGEDNLIAIEMKKSVRPAKEKEDDRKRLRAMTKSSFDGVWSKDGSTHPEHVCGYIMGLYVELDAAKRSALVEHYECGRMSSAKTIAF